ncbi:MAG: response regulator transcription factor [Polyangiales bacterium]
MPRILLVDDDASLIDVLSLALEDAGHIVASTSNGARALELARETTFDVIVSDVNMPLLDGFALCKRLRAAGDATPIVLLTSRDGEIDEALGLELGADDYVSKPFSTRVLLARIDAILRRRDARARDDDAPPIVCGKLTLRVDRVEVHYAGVPIAVTLSELRLLDALVRRPGIVLSRARLLEQVRGDDSVVVDRIIDTYVRRLRRKLEEIEPSFSSIETVVGLGYRWRDDGR